MSDIQKIPRLVVALTYNEAVNYIHDTWPGEDHRGFDIIATEGGTNVALLAGQVFEPDDIVWTSLAEMGRFYPEIRASIQSRIPRV